MTARPAATALVQRDWYPPARRVESPNQDARPPGQEPELIVVHAISLPPGEFGGPYISELFRNRLDPAAHPYFAEIAALRVSAHVLIDREGRLVQYVPFSRRAWHAGVSHWDGRERCNDFSIGIELEGTDDHPFTPVQYTALAGLIRWLRSYFPGIGPQALAGHSDIAPGRKTDPGPYFDWQTLAARLREAEA
ncbi:1,6-anhydro-N-acetylmuramyl-L-alanine amidase AmpD [Thioalkalivibrio sp. ALJT]|uniref:1,6-anhydro-N-acetylmuramyl-L-alanine amidase AmpD n=1 Tax=Thioalkalivibrio sp. ALJT TaxID=1158146 RepID=UPI000372D5BA|nr:1,6-anhydro-N-acetylmuramyl-L-alanine amidase AmpD [Thioalkalivibrio sp. ALJT]